MYTVAHTYTKNPMNELTSVLVADHLMPSLCHEMIAGGLAYPAIHLRV